MAMARESCGILDDLLVQCSVVEAVQNELEFQKVKTLAMANEKCQLKCRLDYLDLQLSVKQTLTADLEAKVFELVTKFQNGAEKFAGMLNQKVPENGSAAESSIAEDLRSLNVLEFNESTTKPKRSKFGAVDSSVVVETEARDSRETSMILALKQENINLRKMNAALTQAHVNRSNSNLRKSQAIFELEIDDKIFKLKCESTEQEKLIEIRECLDKIFKELLEEASELQKVKESSDLNMKQMDQMYKFEISTLRLENVKLKNQLNNQRQIDQDAGFPVKPVEDTRVQQSEHGAGDVAVVRNTVIEQAAIDGNAEASSHSMTSSTEFLTPHETNPFRTSAFLHKDCAAVNQIFPWKAPEGFWQLN